MPTQSKFVRFLRRCCCCVQNCEEDQNKRKTKKNKKSKKVPNNKKLRQKERRQRRNNKSKGLCESDDVQLPPKKTGRKEGDKLHHNSSSLSLPEVNKNKYESISPVTTMSLPTDKIVYQNPSPVTPQRMTSFDCVETPSTLRLSEILVLISSSTSLEDTSTKYNFKKSEDLFKVSPACSWSDLDISLHRLFHNKVPATPSWLSSGFDLRVPFQRLFDARDHSAASSFFSWNDATSCVENLFQQSPAAVQPVTVLPTDHVKDGLSMITSPCVYVDSGRQTATVSECQPPDTKAEQETRKLYCPRQPRWPPNPWLAPKYNGYPEDIPSPNRTMLSNNKDLALSPMDDSAENQTRGQDDREEDSRVVAQSDPQKEPTTHNDDNIQGDSPTRNDENNSSTDEEQKRLLIVSIPSCSGDRLEVKEKEANSQEREDDRHMEEEAEREPKSKEESCSERKTTDTFSRGGSDMTSVQSKASAEADISEMKKQGIGLILSRISPFPVDGVKNGLIPKLSLPSHVYGERLSQFNIDRASRGTNACAINHTLIAVTYYSFGMQSGDVFESLGLKSLPVQKWLWKTISVGNLLHRSIFDPSDCIMATDAFKIVRSSFRLRHLIWRGSGGTHQGLPYRLRMLPRNLSLDIVYPTNSNSSLAYHVSKLNPEHKEAMLYTINNSFFLLLPTLDERVVLIDIHPHPTLGGGALIMFCTKSEQGVQDMLNEFYFKTIKPFHRFSLGQGNIICCKSETEGNKMIPNNLKDWIADV